MPRFQPPNPLLVTRRRVLTTSAVVGLAGCKQLNQSASTDSGETTSREPPTDNPGHTIDLYTDYQTEAWTDKWENDIIPGWDQRSDVPVHIEYPRGPQWPDKLGTLVEEGRPPELYHCQLPEITDLVGDGSTRPVDGLIDDLEAANGALVTDSSVRVGETAHIVPHGLLVGSVFCYRTDVYEDLELSVPETWDDLLANAQAIDEAEAFEGRGFAVAAGDPRSDEKAGADLRTWLANGGGGVWRWADREQGTVELDFRSETAGAALELLQDLGQYSPEPGDLGYAETITQWVQGNVAQCLFPNAWLAGEAYDAGREEVARNTAVALPPKRNRSVEPVDRGWAVVDGTPIFRDADAADEAEAFLRFLYEGPARQAEMNLVRPMQYLPPYADVLTSNTYRNADYFDALDGHLYNLNQRLVDDIAPHLDGDRPRTLATWEVRGKPILSDLVRSVLVDGKSIGAAIETTRDELAARLETAQDSAAP